MTLMTRRPPHLFLHSITCGVQNGKLTAKVFGYDIYKKEEIEKLAVGDKIAFHEEGAAQDQCVTTEVKSIERNDQHHFVSINGGMEQPGGLDLKLEDDDTYRTMTFDDYPLYYEMGEKTMPLAEDVVLKDSSADPQAEAVETTGADAVAAAINADPDKLGPPIIPRWWCRAQGAGGAPHLGAVNFGSKPLTNVLRML